MWLSRCSAWKGLASHVGQHLFSHEAAAHAHSANFAGISPRFFGLIFHGHLVNSAPHIARVTHANTFSRVAQAELTLRTFRCFVSFRKIVILTGTSHVARALYMA